MKYLLMLFLFGLVQYSFQISGSEKSAILKQHNDYRRQVANGQVSGHPAAADMLEMVWDDNLAAVAERHARKCRFAHDSYDDRKTRPFDFVGQNIYGGWDPKDATKLWFEEYKDYHYNNKQCSGMCGHYTQVAWAKSYAVGCAVVDCKSNPSFGGMHYYVVCNYGPAGNFNNEHPYVSGRACSKCPSGTRCNNGLCKK